MKKGYLGWPAAMQGTRAEASRSLPLRPTANQLQRLPGSTWDNDPSSLVAPALARLITIRRAVRVPANILNCPLCLPPSILSSPFLSSASKSLQVSFGKWSRQPINAIYDSTWWTAHDPAINPSRLPCDSAVLIFSLSTGRSVFLWGPPRSSGQREIGHVRNDRRVKVRGSVQHQPSAWRAEHAGEEEERGRCRVQRKLIERMSVARVCAFCSLCHVLSSTPSMYTTSYRVSVYKLVSEITADTI